jgi:hypothetical protein
VHERLKVTKVKKLALRQAPVQSLHEREKTVEKTEDFCVTFQT